ncbi:MAG: AbiJ-NTD4 domain-containing protein [Sulfuricaulis sp.]
MTKRFSERIGVVAGSVELQITGMNEALRNSLWNFLLTLYNNRDWEYWMQVTLGIARFFRKVPTDELPNDNFRCRTWVKEYFFSLQWYEVYDLLEFLINNHASFTTIRIGSYDSHTHSVGEGKLREYLNSIFERELSGYRFVGNILSPISSPAEVQQIEETLAAATAHGLEGAHEHIRSALQLLGRKPEPDYRNSIKEAISAVESVAKVLSGKSAGGLDTALEALAKAAGIHGALKTGFLNLYGYSSNEDGIRHAILEEPNVVFVEAKYMLVACSAFVHYLISKADDAGLLGKNKKQST